MFHMYILRCSDETYYIGHTDNIDARISAHKIGAYSCYTKNRLPVSVAFVQGFTSRYEALAAERRIKKWSRAKKEALIKGDWDLVSDLAKNKINKMKAKNVRFAANRSNPSTSSGRTG